MEHLYYNCIFKTFTGIILQYLPESRCLFLLKGSRPCNIPLYFHRDIIMDELDDNQV